MADEVDLSLVPVLRLEADLPADVVGQLQDLATLMNANGATALHEAIVLANLLYCEATKRGKVTVRQGSTQKVIYLPKVSRKLVEIFRALPGRVGRPGGPPVSPAGPVPVLRLVADLPADVVSQLQELATLMNVNRATALHEAIVLANLLYSVASKSSNPGKVVVRQGGNEKVINLPTVPPDVKKKLAMA